MNLVTYQGFQVDAQAAGDIVLKVIAENGNLIKLTAIERKQYYLAMCDRYALDPFCNPFDYMEQKKWNKDTRTSEVVGISLYPNKRAAEAFGMKNNLSVKIVDKSFEVERGDTIKTIAIVTVEVSDGKRVMQEFGAVEVTDRLGRGDALKKAVTQARRRGILAFCGFSEPDIEKDSISAETFDPPLDVLVQGGIPPVTVEPEPFNRQPSYDAIAAAINALRWTKTQASEECQRRYGKKRAVDLTDSELVDFADYLEGMVKNMAVNPLED